MLTRYCLLILLLSSIVHCSPSRFKSKWTEQKAPDIFKARFVTTKGEFILDVRREWSPQAVDRLYQLLRHRYFRNTPVYRVVPNFVAQFGSIDTAVDNKWKSKVITDEPVVKSNLKGTMAIARGGKDSRSNHFYINLRDNVRLDTSGTSRGVPGFPVIATVTRGMEVVEQLYSYNDTPRSELGKAPKGTDRMKFLREKFPKMDYIKQATLFKY